jgi:hypothetical protein
VPIGSGLGSGEREGNDRALLERVRRGDTEGAAELFERYAPASAAVHLTGFSPTVARPKR